MDDGIRRGGDPVISSAYGPFDTLFVGNPAFQDKEITYHFVFLPRIRSFHFYADEEIFCNYDTLIAVLVRDDETAP